MGHMRAFARRTKMSGSADEYESFRYLEKTLEDYGYDTTLLRHDAYISEPGAARIEIGAAHPACVTHSFSRSSPPAGLTAEIVYAGRGGPSDFAGLDVAGRIVLLDGIALPGPSLLASRAGAVGQIHISPHDHLHDMCISPVWGSPMADERAALPKTVVVSVLHHVGEALKHRLARGERISATLHAEVTTGWRKIPLLVAEMACAAPVPAPADDGRLARFQRETKSPGPAPADDGFVLFSGHHDTWYFGVMDNGGANATMLEAARVLAARRAEWRRGLRLCFWSGHSHGRYAGSAWYADQNWEELAARCVGHVNVDSTGGMGASVLADAVVSAEYAAVAAQAVRKEAGQELVGHRVTRAGDQSFWGIGIASMFMSLSEQPVVPGAGNSGQIGGRLGWWWHTPDDLIDKIDPDFLHRDTRVYVDALWRLLVSAVLPLDPAAALAGLLTQLDALQRDLEGKLSIAPLLARATCVHAQCVALRPVLAAAHGADVAALNAAVLAVTRALVPMDYTSGDRFGHDPALAQSPWPVLDPLRLLAAEPAGTDESLFLRVGAQRALNRVMFALAQASAALGPVTVRDAG